MAKTEERVNYSTREKLETSLEDLQLSYRENNVGAARYDPAENAAIMDALNREVESMADYPQTNAERQAAIGEKLNDMRRMVDYDNAARTETTAEQLELSPAEFHARWPHQAFVKPAAAEYEKLRDSLYRAPGEYPDGDDRALRNIKNIREYHDALNDFQIALLETEPVDPTGRTVADFPKIPDEWHANPAMHPHVKLLEDAQAAAEGRDRWAEVLGLGPNQEQQIAGAAQITGQAQIIVARLSEKYAADPPEIGGAAHDRRAASDRTLADFSQEPVDPLKATEIIAAAFRHPNGIDQNHKVEQDFAKALIESNYQDPTGRRESFDGDQEYVDHALTTMLQSKRNPRISENFGPTHRNMFEQARENSYDLLRELRNELSGNQPSRSQWIEGSNVHFNAVQIRLDGLEYGLELTPQAVELLDQLIQNNRTTQAVSNYYSNAKR